MCWVVVIFFLFLGCAQLRAASQSVTSVIYFTFMIPIMSETIVQPLGVLFATSRFQSFCAAYVVKSLFSLVSYHDLHIDRRTNHKHSFRNLTNSKIDR